MTNRSDRRGAKPGTTLAFAGRRNDWLPARGFHHGPEFTPLKRPKIRVQSDLITSTDVVALRNRDRELLRRREIDVSLLDGGVQIRVVRILKRNRTSGCAVGGCSLGVDTRARLGCRTSGYPGRMANLSSRWVLPQRVAYSFRCCGGDWKVCVVVRHFFSSPYHSS
jgi:hypothetical protein